MKNRRLTSEEFQNDDEFCGNVMRSLRNTHHGYLTRSDINSKRPSRYLSIINGSTSDDFPTLTMLWVLALLASPERFIGNP